MNMRTKMLLLTGSATVFCLLSTALCVYFNHYVLAVLNGGLFFINSFLFTLWADKP